MSRMNELWLQLLIFLILINLTDFLKVSIIVWSIKYERTVENGHAGHPIRQRQAINAHI